MKLFWSISVSWPGDEAQLVLVHVADGFAARLQDQLNLADSEEIKKDQAYLDRVCAELQKEGFKAQAI